MTRDLAQRSVGRDEKVTLAAAGELGRAADDPVVGALGSGADQHDAVLELPLADELAGRSAVEDDDRASGLALGPGPAQLDQLLLRYVRPLRAQDVARVDEGGQGLGGYEPAGSSTGGVP